MRKLLLALFIPLSFFSHSQQTYIPDDNFEAFLENNGLGNGIPNDDSVTTSNVSGLTDLIVPNTQGIANLTGIEDFSALTLVILNGNPISAANFSQNSQLNYVSMIGCGLNSISVNQCPLLQTLLISNNNLVVLNVSNNPLLEVLNCTSNDLITLDVTQNPALLDLQLTLNSLNSLNVSQNPLLSNLACVQNSLTSLDVTHNTHLKTLDCRNNQLTNLEIGQNDSLEILFCRSNQLKALDVSQCPNLYNLNCSINDLRCLHAANSNAFENPLAPGFYMFVSFGNVNLSCAEVSFPAIADASYITDAGTSFALTCPPNAPNNAVIQNGNTLAASMGNLVYQWVDCDNGNAPISGATNQFFTPTATGNYAVEITVEDLCGSTTSVLSDCIYVIDYTGIEELINTEKELVKIIDLTGRETELRPNTPLILMYSDGSVERVMEIVP